MSRLRIVASALLLLLMPALAMASEGGGEHESKLLWHAINLALVLGVLFYFARSPIRTYMAERRQNIEAGIEAARSALAEAERHLAACNARITSLDREVEEIRRSARQQLRNEAAEMAVRLAGDLLKRQVTDSDRARLVDEFVERVESLPPATATRS